MFATENVYLAAYLRTEGAELKTVQVSRSEGRSTAVFELDGPSVQRAADSYYAGTATVNLAAYRRHLEALKDELFGALRRETREPRAHDDERTERRTDDETIRRRSRHHAHR